MGDRVRTKANSKDSKSEVSNDEDNIQRLETGLQIDEHALDEALQYQPDLFYRVSARLSHLISERDYAKQELEEIEAEVSVRLRLEAEKEKTKLSVAECEALKTIDSEVVKASRKMLDLQRMVGQYSALKEAFNQRSYALKDLVALHIANYYSDSAQSNQQRKERYEEDRRALKEARRGRA